MNLGPIVVVCLCRFLSVTICGHIWCFNGCLSAFIFSTCVDESGASNICVGVVYLLCLSVDVRSYLLLQWLSLGSIFFCAYVLCVWCFCGSCWRRLFFLAYCLNVIDYFEAMYFGCLSSCKCFVLFTYCFCDCLSASVFFCCVGVIILLFTHFVLP